MFQVRFHGRGGQDVVTAAELLASAAFREGRHAQAFPSFGSERMGAPVMSFCRIDDAADPDPRAGAAEPDALIIQDPTLLPPGGPVRRARPRLAIIPEVAADFSARFGRRSGDLVRPYLTHDAEIVVVTLGSARNSSTERAARSGDGGNICPRRARSGGR